MIKIRLAVLACGVASISSAHAQSRIVSFIPGIVLTAAQLNQLQDGKADYAGLTTEIARAEAAEARLVLTQDGASTNQSLGAPIITGGSVNGALQVASQSAFAGLSNTSIGSLRLAHRSGFSVPGDGGAADYTLSAAPCALSSGAGDGGSQIPAPGGGCWIASFGAGEANARVWGAKFDGVTDDTGALQGAINWAATNGKSLILPCGTALFTATLRAPGGTNNWTVRGADNGVCSSLVYNGASTTNDLIVVGNLGTADDSYGVTITGFRLDSNVLMTAGDALHLWHLKQSRVDPTLSGQSGNGMFWNGLHYDEVDIVRTPNAYIYGAANDNVLANGSKSTESWYANYVAEVRLGQGKIAPSDPQLNRGGSRQYSQTGVHVAGSVGGFTIQAVDIIANHHDVVVDNAVTGIQNQTVLLGPEAMTDSSIGDNIVLNDTGSTSVPGFGGTKRFYDYGWNACGGCASGSGNGVTIQNFTNGTVVLAGYAIQGNQGYGAYVADSSATVTISSSEVFGNNSSANVGASAPGMRISSNNPVMLSGVPYDTNAIKSTLSLYGGPYAFTPEIHFGGNSTGVTYTTQIGNYTLDGRNVTCDFSVVLSSVGTSTGAATIAGLPIGQDSSTGGLGGGGTINYAAGLSSLTGAVMLSMDGGGSGYANLYQWSASGVSVLADTNFTASAKIRGRLSFIRP